MTDEKPLYGGRAMPNGVMMVGPDRMAIAVRQGDGTIKVESSPFQPPLAPWRKTPFIRGPVAIGGAILLAVKSANLQRSMASARSGQAKQMGKVMLPIVALSLVERVMRNPMSRRNGSERTAKPGLFGTFLPLFAFRLLGLTGPGKQLLKYHAAEHMAVNAAEAGAALTADEAGTFSRIHPRCGTTFAVWAMLLTWLSRPFARGGFRTLLIGLATISVSFELLHLGARHRDEPWAQAVFGPSWQAQQLTTMPADREHVEVAVAALSAVMPATVSETEPASDIV